MKKKISVHFIVFLCLLQIILVLSVSFSNVYHQYYPGAIAAALRLLLLNEIEVELKAVNEMPSCFMTMDFEKIGLNLIETDWNLMGENEENTVYQKGNQFMQYFKIKQTGPFFFYYKYYLSIPISFAQTDVNTVSLSFMGSSNTVFLRDKDDKRMQRMIQICQNIQPVFSDKPLDMRTAILVCYEIEEQAINLTIDENGVFILSNTKTGNWIPLISENSDEIYQEIKRYLS